MPFECVTSLVCLCPCPPIGHRKRIYRTGQFSLYYKILLYSIFRVWSLDRDNRHNILLPQSFLFRLISLLRSDSFLEFLLRRRGGYHLGVFSFFLLLYFPTYVCIEIFPQGSFFRSAALCFFSVFCGKSFWGSD